MIYGAIQMTIMLFGCSGAFLNNGICLTFAPFSPCLPSVPPGPAGPLRRETQNSKHNLSYTASNNKKGAAS